MGDTPDSQGKHGGSGRYAIIVGLGILLSRVFGLVRDRVFAHYFGNSDAADAFRAAFRIPNLLQNLFGEGVLSASFIPVYANLLARGEKEEANRVAGAVFSLLAMVVSVLVLVGVVATPWLIDGIAPGFHDEKRELAIQIVRILFPGAGLLVLSAWCLGILNSHRRFLLSYTAPVMWNVVMIAALLGFGPRMGQFPLAAALAWASVAGSAIQFAVQLPAVFRCAPGLRPSFIFRSENVRTVVRNFFPVFIGHGVVQISAYMDAFIGSLLPTGAVAAISYSQTLYLLPLSLFGMSVSAAELPLMSGMVGEATEVAAWLRKRLDAGLRRIAYFIVPSSMAFLALGDVAVGAIYQTGAFTRDDTVYVWAILAGATIGLLAGTQGRLYVSTFYALKDTRTPLRCALARVTGAAALGLTLSYFGPGLLGLEARWGAVGVTVGSGIAAWSEFVLLKRFLNRRIGSTGLSGRFLIGLWIAAIGGVAGAWGVKLLVGTMHPIPAAVAILGTYGIIYVGITWVLKVPEVSAVTGRLNRMVQRLR